MDNLGIVQKSFIDSVSAKEAFFTEERSAELVKAAELIATCFKAGGKVLIMGNGGSAADAQHLAAEFVNRFVIERPPLPALALTTDTSILTSIGNDYSFDAIFVKQIRALGKEGDVLLAISTSGNSTNVVNGVIAAASMGIKVVTLTGGDGGKLGEKADIELKAAGESTARIQEVHITVLHILCELVDHILFQTV